MFHQNLNSAPLEKNYKYKSFLVLGYISVKSWFWDYLEFFLVIMKIWLNSNSRLFASKILLFFILGFYTKVSSNNVFSYFRLLNSYFNSFLIFFNFFVSLYHSYFTWISFVVCFFCICNFVLIFFIFYCFLSLYINLNCITKLLFYLD
jgi:hypothetical protein